MNHVDLFNGIGGFAIAAEAVWGDEYVNLGHSEIEKFPCQVYHKHFPQSKCLGDITKIDWSKYAGRVDILTGGVPCQPASVAGQQRGKSDNRWLWPEAFRALREIHPRWCIFENVRGLLVLEGGLVFDELLSEMESYSYEVQAFIIPACAVNAPHRRDRVWIVAYNNNTVVICD
jgi:DNA (cytosine-5)-methyltransferase 1